MGAGLCFLMLCVLYACGSPTQCPSSSDAKYGDKVVEAAVNEGAHYCDLTGEFHFRAGEPWRLTPPFLLYNPYQAVAAQQKF